MKYHFKLRLNKINYISIFLCLFPILPYYFKFFSLEMTTLVALALFICYCVLLCIKNKPLVLCNKFDTVDFAIIAWALIRCLQYLFDGQFIGAVNVFSRSILAGFVMIRVINSKEKFLRAIDIVIYTGGVLAVFGIIESFTHFNVFSLLNNTNAILNYNAVRFGLLRILSFSSHTIVYCVYIMFIINLAFYRITVESRENLKRTILQIIYILLFINAILTLSRSAILFLLLSQIMVMYMCGFKKFLKKMLLIGLIMAIVIAWGLAVGGVLATFIKNVVAMLLAVFNSDLTEVIAGSYGADNISAVGNRIDLYGWVWEDVKDTLFMGKGGSAKFSHMMTVYSSNYVYRFQKTSIEVQYLNILFHFGLIGLVSEVFANIALLVKSFSCRRLKQKWEPKIGFGTLSFIVLLCYFLQMFAVNQSSDVTIFYLFCMLLLTYYKHHAFAEQ